MKAHIRKAVVLVSGGMDSLVTTAVAHSENDEIYLLHFNYGQRTEQKELEAFTKICEHYQPKDSKIITLDFIKEFGGNSLTDTSLEIPSYNEKKTLVSIAKGQLPNTYVPYRNGIFMSIACGWAEVLVASRVYIGAVEVDWSGYPDCRKVFFEALQTALNRGTKDQFHIDICTPLICLNKAEIVRLGVSLNAPLQHSWSCYQSQDIPCGVCDSCYLRQKGFDVAGLEDPILQQKK